MENFAFELKTRPGVEESWTELKGREKSIRGVYSESQRKEDETYRILYKDGKVDKNDWKKIKLLHLRRLPNA